MDSEAVERLMDVMLQMKINFAHVAETLQQQTLEIRRELGIVFEEEMKNLEECLVGIDQKLKECAASVENYRSLHAHLKSMREKLVLLGAQPGPLPEPLPAVQFDEIVAWRLRELKCEGKV